MSETSGKRGCVVDLKEWEKDYRDWLKLRALIAKMENSNGPDPKADDYEGVDDEAVRLADFMGGVLFPGVDDEVEAEVEAEWDDKWDDEDETEEESGR